MKDQYDFEEQLISQHVPTIVIPSMNLPIAHSRHTNPLGQLQKYLLESQLHAEQKKALMQKQQRYIGQQIQKQLACKQSKIKKITEEAENKRLNQCTFQPNAHEPRTPPRNLSQFLEEQKKFTERVNLKKNILRKTLEESREKPTHHPQINPNKNSNHQSQSVFERLYALKDKENQETNGVNSFHPQIQDKSKNMQRNTPIEQLLYSDALRRQQKAKTIIKQSYESKGQKLCTNLQNQKYAAQKFIKQYFLVLQRLNIKPSRLSYTQFNQLLKQLCFVRSQQQQSYFSVQERVLLQSAYHLLQQTAVNARNVCVFLLALQGIFSINPINFQTNPQPQPQFALDQAQGRQFQKQYDLLKRNRLNMSKKEEVSVEEHSFQPIINHQSIEMADRHRALMLQEANRLIEECPETVVPSDGVISHTDLLVLSNLAKENRVRKQKQQYEDRSMEGCTFKPTTLSHNQSVSSAVGYKKSMELYHHKKSTEGGQRSTDLEECTFAPAINKNKINTNNVVERKEVTEAVLRMRKGREIEKQKKKFLQRGELLHNHTSRRNTGSSLQMSIPEEEYAPTLILDVNLGDKIDRILIYKGDEKRLDHIAKEFAIKHSLEKFNQQKLLEMLTIELENVLTKIEEDQEQQI